MSGEKKLLDVATFERMDIHDLEILVFNGRGDEVDAQRRYVATLAYLRNSKRYRENPTYAKSNFKEYLEGRFNIKHKQFEEMEAIYIAYPEEAQKYGVGQVLKAQKTAGKKALPKIFEALEAKQQKQKKPLSAKQATAVIETFIPIPKEGERTNWKQLYDQAQARVEELEFENKALHTHIQEYEFENQKLKELVAELQAQLKTTQRAKRTTPVRRKRTATKAEVRV